MPRRWRGCIVKGCKMRAPMDIPDEDDEYELLFVICTEHMAELEEWDAAVNG